MSEDEARRIGANQEPKDEEETEAHRARLNESTEPKQEGDEDEVEAHRARVNRPGKTA